MNQNSSFSCLWARKFYAIISRTRSIMSPPNSGQCRNILSVHVGWVVCGAIAVMVTLIVSGGPTRATTLNGSSSSSRGGSGRTHKRSSSPEKIRTAWAGSSRADAAFPLLPLHFCLGCQDPAAEGSLGRSLGRSRDRCQNPLFDFLTLTIQRVVVLQRRPRQCTTS